MSTKDSIVKKLKQNRELLGGSSKLIIFRVGGMGLSYLFTLLVSRYYGSSTLGLFAMMNVVLLISVLLTRGGMDILFLRQVSALMNKQDEAGIRSWYSGIVSKQLVVGSIISALLFFLAPWIAESIFDTPSMTNVLRMAAMVVLPLAINTLHSEGFRARKKLFPYIALSRGWHFALASVGVAFLWLTDVEDPFYFFLVYFGAVLTTMLIGSFQWNQPKAFRFNKFDLSEWKSTFQASTPMLLASSMFLVMSWTDTFMLGVFETPDQVGGYHVAVKISNLITIVLFGINGITAPKLSSSFAAGDTKLFKQTVTSSASLSFLLSLPVILCIIFFRTELLGLFDEEMVFAGTALILLSIGQFVNGSSGSVMNILQMTNNQVTGQNILLVAGALNIVLNYLLIPRYGIEGAAMSTAFSTVFWNLASVVAVRIKLKVWSIPFSYKFRSGIRYLLGR
jgi:O-antigen/teichoic acid export membrane protein